ncbi:MAG: Asp-tRNA(Asn)/Glu-tRNA(Gln) amidotransferase subunit GatB [Firmicutes bacterium]|nr:Asp-tRNA(Asn)/Glu-tRNA(Gln) amidotransferase subunit GatB [Bacillota bacterium]
MSDYKKTIGIEIHCELNSNTKIFSNSINGYGKTANSNVNVVDLGYPGVLPTLNMEVIRLALKAALILNCEINKEMHFDRKNYFYPDNPKNYQITQLETPIGVNGWVEIEVNGQKKKIRIHDIHIEEDTCKSIHYKHHSFLDFNRAGVPLVEIVTEADITSSEEAMAYVEKLRELFLYADVSDCKIEEGSMRCDVNISISKTDEWGTRAEIKNIGSISNVGRAIEREAIRQEELIENGGSVVFATYRYDEKEDKTIMMRVKEAGNDYRYFPEPDIPFVVIDDNFIEDVRKSIPMLASERREKYVLAGISELNANKIIQNRSLSNYLNRFLDKDIDLVVASNLLLGDIAGYLNKTGALIDNTKLNDEKFITVVTKLSKGDINSKVFKDILDDLMESDSSVDEIISSKGIKIISDPNELKNIISTILSNNENSVNDYKSGNERAIKFLMGQIMKETKGSANPELVNKLLLEELNK